MVDFSLPEAPPRKERRVLPGLTFLLSLVSVGLLAYLLFRSSTGAGSSPLAAASEEVARLEKVAEDLERRTFYRAAAEAWAEYQALAREAPAERARTLYRRAKNRSLAGDFEEAVALLTRHDRLVLDAELPREERQRGDQLLLECLSALGKEEVRTEFLASRTSANLEGEKGTTIAQVGGDAITLEALRRELASQVRQALAFERQLLSEEETEARVRERVEAELKKPETVRRILQGLIQREVLYREGLAQGFGQGEQLKREVERFRRSALAERVVVQEMRAAQANLSEADLDTHYAAHRAEYVERAGARFSYRRFASEAEARAALGETEGFVAAEGPARAGEPLPGLGRSAQATAQLLALEAGELGQRPLEVGESWYLFRVDERLPERQLSREEARERVRADLTRRKQAEAVQKLEERLGLKFQVQVFEERLPKVEGSEAGAPEAGAPEAGATGKSTGSGS